HWPQPILSLSAFQWPARKICSRPGKDTNEEQYVMSIVTSGVDSDGRRLTVVLDCDWSIELILLYQSSSY
uniref:3'-5' exonuclease domain-containing protein n=1 Tax=Mesocestoides corti TaxID=53468 RepID=A0A5K3FST7_MESCO